MFFVKKEMPEYKDPLSLLENALNEDIDKEVLYTFEGQHIIKENNKYYISNIENDVKLKELSRSAAYEMIQDIKFGQKVNKPNEYID